MTDLQKTQIGMFILLMSIGVNQKNGAMEKVLTTGGKPG
jgi:hypothetical protein